MLLIFLVSINENLTRDFKKDTKLDFSKRNSMSISKSFENDFLILKEKYGKFTILLR